MALNGIDIASYQKGINLGIVPCDFVIIKATQGTSYVNPDFERAYKQAKDNGKLLGIYHYGNGAGATKEADFFIKVVGARIGEAVLVIDWESAQNSQFGKSDVTYVKTFCDRVYNKTDVRPMVYMSKSVCRRLPVQAVDRLQGIRRMDGTCYLPIFQQGQIVWMER